MGNDVLTQELDCYLKGDPVAEAHNSCSVMAEALGMKDGNEIKPCVAIPFVNGCDSRRNDTGHIIASELRRLGFNEEEAAVKIIAWNSMNKPPMPFGEMNNILRSAYKRRYKYGCLSRKIEPTCVGKENCQFIKQGKGKYPKKVLWRDIILKGWMPILSDSAKLIYGMALPELEYRRQSGPGKPLYAGHREIAIILGRKSHSSMGKYLKELARYELIEYTPGDPLKKNRKASEITRIVPVPNVPEIIKDFKT